jgi:hypothetical protein
MFAIQLIIIDSSFVNMGFLCCVSIETFFVEMENLNNFLNFAKRVVTFLKVLRELWTVTIVLNRQ